MAGRLRAMALHLPGQLTDTPLKDPERPALAKLVLNLDGRTVAEYPLVPGRLVVGRAGESDISVDSKFVSRNHCQIITSAHGTMVEDLNSTNGVHIQGIRVRRHELTDGDTISLGRHDLVYVDLRHANTIAGLDPTSTAVFEIQRREVPEPQAGHIIVHDGDSFVVQGEPRQDAERLIWTLDTRPA